MKTYEMIAGDIQEKIETGVYVDGEQLPSLRKLSKTYGSTPVTIKKSLSILEENGYVDILSRRGTFVKAQKNRLFTLIFHELKNIDQLTETKLVEIKEFDSEQFKKKFSLEETKPFKCIQLKKILYQKKIPIGVDLKYLIMGSKKSLPVRNEDNFEESLTKVLNNYDIIKELEIRVLEDNKLVQRLLFLDDNEPVFRFQQIYQRFNGQLVGASETYVPCSEVRIKIEN